MALAQTAELKPDRERRRVDATAAERCFLTLDKISRMVEEEQRRSRDPLNFSRYVSEMNAEASGFEQLQEQMSHLRKQSWRDEQNIQAALDKIQNLQEKLAKEREEIKKVAAHWQARSADVEGRAQAIDQQQEHQGHLARILRETQTKVKSLVAENQSCRERCLQTESVSNALQRQLVELMAKVKADRISATKMKGTGKALEQQLERRQLAAQHAGCPSTPTMSPTAGSVQAQESASELQSKAEPQAEMTAARPCTEERAAADGQALPWSEEGQRIDRESGCEGHTSAEEDLAPSDWQSLSNLETAQMEKLLRDLPSQEADLCKKTTTKAHENVFLLSEEAPATASFTQQLRRMQLNLIAAQNGEEDRPLESGELEKKAKRRRKDVKIDTDTTMGLREAGACDGLRSMDLGINFALQEVDEEGRRTKGRVSSTTAEQNQYERGAYRIAPPHRGETRVTAGQLRHHIRELEGEVQSERASYLRELEETEYVSDNLGKVVQRLDGSQQVLREELKQCQRALQGKDERIRELLNQIQLEGDLTAALRTLEEDHQGSDYEGALCSLEARSAKLEEQHAKSQHRIQELQEKLTRTQRVREETKKRHACRIEAAENLSAEEPQAGQRERVRIGDARLALDRDAGHLSRLDAQAAEIGRVQLGGQEELRTVDDELACRWTAAKQLDVTSMSSVGAEHSRLSEQLQARQGDWDRIEEARVASDREFEHLSRQCAQATEIVKAQQQRPGELERMKSELAIRVKAAERLNEASESNSAEERLCFPEGLQAGQQERERNEGVRLALDREAGQSIREGAPAAELGIWQHGRLGEMERLNSELAGQLEVMIHRQAKAVQQQECQASRLEEVEVTNSHLLHELRVASEKATEAEKVQQILQSELQIKIGMIETDYRQASQLSIELAAAQREGSDLLTQLQMMEADAARATVQRQEEKHYFSARIGELTDQLSLRDMQIKDLTLVHSQDVEHGREELDKRLDAPANRAQEQQELIANLRLQLSSLETQLITLEERAAQHEQRYSQAQRSLAVLQLQLNFASQSRASAQQGQQEWKSRVVTLEADMSRLRKQYLHAVTQSDNVERLYQVVAEAENRAMTFRTERDRMAEMLQAVQHDLRYLFQSDRKQDDERVASTLDKLQEIASAADYNGDNHVSARTVPVQPSAHGSSNAGRVSIDPDHGVKNKKVLVIELGATCMRAALVEPDVTSFTFAPCMVARPRKNNAKVWEIVQHAGICAGKGFGRFREHGYFLGRDAWHVCMEHPDAALRGQLQLQKPYHRGVLVKQEELEILCTELLGYVEQVDLEEVPVIVVTRATAPPRERMAITRILFEACDASRVRLIDDAVVIAKLVNREQALIIDIGEEQTRMVPVCVSTPCDAHARVNSIGGADLTAYLYDLVLSCKNERFSSLHQRQQLAIVADMKVQHAYVAIDFEKEIEKSGAFEREIVNVMKAMRREDDISALSAGRLGSIGEQAPASELLRTYRARLPAGEQLVMSISRERFYTGEILFKPELYRGEDNIKRSSLPDLVLGFMSNLDEDSQCEYLSNIILVGHTSRLPGLKERLQMELALARPDLASSINILVAEADGGATSSGQIIPEGRTFNSFAPLNSLALQAATVHAPDIEKKEWLTSAIYDQEGPEVTAEEWRFARVM